MALNIFKKKDQKRKDQKTKPEPQAEVAVETKPTSFAAREVAGQGAYRILTQAYISEKASMLSALNQYVFKVAPDAGKQEIAKQVGALYNVKVKQVRLLTMPRKRKDLGRHPGFRSGFRKAVVTLEAGQTISR
ncbi:MAG: 50S ribosomal protein L23 [Candidatus Yanofskybacteria bacterium]|nr:50S ribosomal protein L23 [Candidatus Yanofskybacteria bacterium]